MDVPDCSSAVGTAVWAAIGFLAYWLWPLGNRTSRRRPAVIFSLSIFSHYILDVISHVPDMPLMGNNTPKVGFSLWNSFAATVTVEVGMLFLGVILYRRVTRSFSASGKYGLTLMIAILMVLYISGLFGPPPPDMMTVGIMITVGQLAFVALAFWIDRKRITIRPDRNMNDFA